LLQEGTDIKYGARHLKRAIEKYVVYPLANLLATEQIRFGDMLVIDWDAETRSCSFHREGQGAAIPAPPRRPARASAARSVAGGAGEERLRAPATNSGPVTP